MPEMTNALRRAQVLAQIEKDLMELLPDEGCPAVRSFDDLEAAAVRMGDALACAAMTKTLDNVFTLPQCTKQGRCKCGRKLIWSDKPRTLETVRGSISITRLHGYCRVCERGFFPRG